MNTELSKEIREVNDYIKRLGLELPAHVASNMHDKLNAIADKLEGATGSTDREETNLNADVDKQGPHAMTLGGNDAGTKTELVGGVNEGAKEQLKAEDIPVKE